MTEGYVVGGDRLATVVRGFLTVEENGFRRCDVPAGPLQAQIRLLLERRVRQGVVFACCSAPWARVAANGWTFKILQNSCFTCYSMLLLRLRSYLFE